LLGITRQAYYDWLNEKTRPNIQQAQKLAKLTGLSINQIRARE
jgi:DNA-binding XRE family transcriptional regulator